MDVEKAIKTAIEYETRVRDVYNEAMEKSKSDQGKKIYRQLAKEEQGHLDYLNHRLNEWQKTGKVTPEKLQTTIPSKKTIEEGVGKLKSRLKEPDAHGEMQMLTKALDVEIATSNFYREMVNTLEGDAQIMFSRFMEIEEGHLALVQAEINSLQGMGVWFDTIEFDLEGAG
jgi:rubrerythrin